MLLGLISSKSFRLLGTYVQYKPMLVNSKVNLKFQGFSLCKLRYFCLIAGESGKQLPTRLDYLLEGM